MSATGLHSVLPFWLVFQIQQETAFLGRLFFAKQMHSQNVEEAPLSTLEAASIKSKSRNDENYAIDSLLWNVYLYNPP